MSRQRRRGIIPTTHPGTHHTKPTTHNRHVLQRLPAQGRALEYVAFLSLSLHKKCRPREEPCTKRIRATPNEMQKTTQTCTETTPDSVHENASIHIRFGAIARHIHRKTLFKNGWRTLRKHGRKQTIYRLPDGRKSKFMMFFVRLFRIIFAWKTKKR